MALIVNDEKFLRFGMEFFSSEASARQVFALLKSLDAFPELRRLVVMTQDFRHC
jgi:hypothetical protein